MSDFLRKHKELLSLAILAAIFFFIYLFLYLNPSVLTLPSVGNGFMPFRDNFSESERNGTSPFPTFLILNQPDEFVNYFFIRQLVLENRFNYFEPLSALALNQIHPRSTTVINGALAPIGFPGMIVIFSLILKAFLVIAPMAYFNLLAVSLTPLIAALTPFFLYGFLRRVFPRNVAWLSAVLLFVLPPWWYYASRPFQHNTVFVFFIAALLYCYVKFVIPSEAPPSGAESRDLLNFRLARDSSASPAIPRGSVGMTFVVGLLFGLAVYVRPVEIVWLTVLGIVGLAAAFKSWSRKDYLGLGAGLILTAILFFATQTAFYGQPLGSGYVRPEATGAAGSILSGQQNIPLLKAIFLPFGFHPGAILHNIRAYFVDLFGIWMMAAFLGGIILVWKCFHDIASPDLIGAKQSSTKTGLLRRFAPRKIMYLGLLFFVLCSLLIYYGSWSFFDNLIRAPSIGTSYVRYFLPIYVFSLPLAAWLIIWLWQRSKILKLAATAVVLVLLWSAVSEVFAPLEGLASVKKTIQTYQLWQAEIYRLTESNSIIITRYADKYLFPGRQVIPGWQEPEQIQAIGNLAKAGHPLYLYDLKLSEKEMKELNDKLRDKGLKLSEAIAEWKDLEIRKVLKIKD